MSQIISVQVDDLIKNRLDILAQAKGKTQSDIMRTAINQYLNKNRADIVSIETSKEEDTKVPKESSVSLGSLTTYDRAVIKEWELAYGLSNTRVFAPPIKQVLNKLRKEGFSQTDILHMVRHCREVPIVRTLEQKTGAKAPPLSSILSAKMVPYLLELLDDGEQEECLDFSLEDYKRECMDEVWDEIPHEQMDKFRLDIMGCKDKEEVDACIGEYMERVKHD